MSEYNTSNRQLQGGSRWDIGGTLTAGDSDTTLLSRVRIKEIPITADFDNTEQDSGWDIPANSIVLDVFLKITTADSGETLDVGTDGSGSNDPNGYLAGASVATLGLVKGTLASAGQTKGALLRVDESGAGVLVPEGDVSSGGESLTYTGSAATNTMRGSIFVVYIDLA